MVVVVVFVRYVLLIKDMCNVKMVKYYVLGVIFVCVLVGYFVWYVFNFGLIIIFGWMGFLFIVVSSVYLLCYFVFFRKCEDGVILFYICWIFVFFLLGSWLYNEYVWCIDKVFFL